MTQRVPHPLLWLLLATPLSAQGMTKKILEVERLPNGDTLITDGGIPETGPPGIAFVVRPDHTLVHSWRAENHYPHSAELIGDGQILWTDTMNDRIQILDRDGSVAWDSDWHAPFSDGSTLWNPNDAELLPNGNIIFSDRDNHRVVEMDLTGNIVWQFGETGVSGSDLSHMKWPHNMERLANGNTLIPDTDNNRILEVDGAGAVVWLYEPTGAEALRFPRDADELPDGAVLIADSHNSRLVVVERSGSVRSVIPLPANPYEADYLGPDRYLVGGGAAYEVDGNGTTLWRYPPGIGEIIDTPAVVNPSSGVFLDVCAHIPADATAQNPKPGVVRIPAGIDDGTGFHIECEHWAKLGIAAVHFSPDARGSSTNGGAYLTEDYGGFIHQDGLRQVVLDFGSRPEVDASRIALYSDGHGVTMASGLVSRYPDDPPILAVFDWEGEASRIESAQANGGFIPEDPGSQSFWVEREAITFLPDTAVPYYRLQSANDAIGVPGNPHAIDLANAATALAFGGGGAAVASQVNGELRNPANRPWSPADPPAWISDLLEGIPFRRFLVHEILQRRLETPHYELLGVPQPGAPVQVHLQGTAVDAGRAFVHAISDGPGPSPMTDGGWVSLTLNNLTVKTRQSGVLDAAGQAFLNYTVSPNPNLSGRTFFGQAIVLRPEDPIPYLASEALPILVQ